MSQPKSDIELGDAAYGSDLKTVTYEAGEAITAGDVVAINTGQLALADGTTDTNALAVAAEDIASGDNGSVYLEGPVAANVATGVAAGEELTVSATEGQLAAGAGDFDALSDEGAISGLSHGAGLAANAAVVNF